MTPITQAQSIAPLWVHFYNNRHGGFWWHPWFVEQYKLLYPDAVNTRSEGINCRSTQDLRVIELYYKAKETGRLNGEYSDIQIAVWRTDCVEYHEYDGKESVVIHERDYLAKRMLEEGHIDDCEAFLKLVDDEIHNLFVCNSKRKEIPREFWGL